MVWMVESKWRALTRRMRSGAAGAGVASSGSSSSTAAARSPTAGPHTAMFSISSRSLLHAAIARRNSSLTSCSASSSGACALLHSASSAAAAAVCLAAACSWALRLPRAFAAVPFCADLPATLVAVGRPCCFGLEGAGEDVMSSRTPGDFVSNAARLRLSCAECFAEDDTMFSAPEAAV